MNGEHQRRSAAATIRAIAAWLLIGAVASTVVVTVLVPRLAGATPYVILTGSMKPSLPPGTVVVTRPVAAQDLALGAVVTYQVVSGEPEVVTHRVVAKGIDATGQSVIRTRGDANNGLDPGWIKPVQIRGERWYAIPYVGRVDTVLSGIDRELLSRVIAACLLGYAAALALIGLRDRMSATGRGVAPSRLSGTRYE